MGTSHLKKSKNKSIRIQILNLQDEQVVVYRHTGHEEVRITVRLENKSNKGDTLLEGRNETMAEQLAEERNWDALCEKAEKLREQKILGKNRIGAWKVKLYYNVAKRREKKRRKAGRKLFTKRKGSGKQTMKTEK